MKINYWAKLEPGVCYHIYNRAVGNEKLFLSSDHYAYFLDKWQTYITPYFSTYAYCLMPNHFHFLAKAKPLNDIHHNYAQDYGQWAHCSYRSFFHDPPPWMAIEPVIKLYSLNNSQDG